MQSLKRAQQLRTYLLTGSGRDGASSLRAQQAARILGLRRAQLQCFSDGEDDALGSAGEPTLL